MEKPLVSVLIPTFQRARTLPRAIEGALAQTYRPIEIIVVDNASNDGTDKVFASYGKQDEVRLLRHGCNIGPVRNWLSAVRASEGELIKINWSDDWMERSVVASLVEAMDGGRTADFAVCGTTLHARGRTIQYPLIDGPIGPAELVRAFGSGSISLPVSPGAGLVLRSDALWALERAHSLLGEGCVDRAIGPDLLMLYAAIRRGGRGVRIASLGAHFEGGPDSISMLSSKRQLTTCYLEATDCLLNEAGAPVRRIELRQILAMRRAMSRLWGNPVQYPLLEDVSATAPQRVRALAYATRDIWSRVAASMVPGQKL